MNCRFLSFYLLLIAGNLSAQNINPDPDKIYRPDEVGEIRLILSAEDKAFLLDNPDLEEFRPATFTMINSQINQTLSVPVGIRLRGNTSRWATKKSFKIDFREYGGGKFHDYKKFNLKPDVNDPSMLRELLTLKLYREMNVPAAQASHVKLYMNDEYMGIYLNVEQIDDEFLDKRFGHEEGLLYKCAYGASLENNNQIYSTSVFESELNEDSDDRSQLENFVEVLNGTYHPAQAGSFYQSIFEVDNYLRQLAVEAVLGHWDGYSYNMNNFYLFYNDETDKFHFMPYDADNTWGIDWVGTDWGKRDLNLWYNTNQPRPLTKNILTVPAFKEKYLRYVRLFVTQFFNEDYLIPLLDQYEDLLDLPVKDDTYFDDAFGFSYTDFKNSLYTFNENHVRYGIRDYIETRTAYALEQVPNLITATEEEVKRERFIYPNPAVQPFFTYCGLNEDNVSIYTVSGQKLKPVITHDTEGCAQVTLPDNFPAGLYIIEANGIRTKWVYR